MGVLQGCVHRKAHSWSVHLGPGVCEAGVPGMVGSQMSHPGESASSLETGGVQRPRGTREGEKRKSHAGGRDRRSGQVPQAGEEDK